MLVGDTDFTKKEIDTLAAPNFDDPKMDDAKLNNLVRCSFWETI
jgi:hypothetical protein